MTVMKPKNIGVPPSRQAKPLRAQQPTVPPPTHSAVLAKQIRKPPAAPPVFKPQNTPKVLQTKMHVANQRVSSSKATPVAPPVYRPQTKKIVQAKMASPVRTTPAAPPAYRPQPTPKVLQLKSTNAKTGASGQQPSSMPPRRSQPGGRVVPRAVAQLSPALRRAGSQSHVIQRAKITIGSETIDTSTMTVFDLAQKAQALYREGTEASKNASAAIYAAIERGETLPEKEEDVDVEALGPIDVSDLGEEEEPDEADTPSPTLLSRGEIIRLHKSSALDAKGFRYDNLTTIIASATRETKIEDKIAVLVWGVVEGHTFNDGNKRTGLLMLQAMAGKNGKKIHGDPREVLTAAADKKSGLTEGAFKTEIGKLLIASTDERKA